MGAGASVENGESAPDKPIVVNLKKLPDVIEESLFVHEKFPLVIDPTEQASRFLKYQVGTFTIMGDVELFTVDRIKRSYVNGLRYGRTMTIKTDSISKLLEFFVENGFSEKFLQRELLYKEELWKTLLDTSLGDPPADEFVPSEDFLFVLCCVKEEELPHFIASNLRVIKVDDSKSLNSENSTSNPEDDAMAQVAALYGAKEIIRNSTQLVEAAFDGELEELISWVEKGYSIESVDGRKHSALSEASCQGHLEVVKYLMEAGADPNSTNDNGRSPLWRATFGGHKDVVEYLLQCGADPLQRDKVSMEASFDVAQDEEIRNILANWDIKITEKLKESRRKQMIMKMEENIKTAAERELYAKMKLRQELIEKTKSGDVDGVKEMLKMLADEAEISSSKPRATAETRNETGQSLLSIATQQDDVDMARMLLTHWKECDKDEYSDFNGGNNETDSGLTTRELSVEAQTFKTNPNSRDLKGWNCVAVAVFHNAKKVLPLLLDHGGNPNIRSSYGKSALDIAKDELDAANNIMVDKSDIRKVFEDWDRENNSKKSIFGNSEVAPICCGAGNITGDTLQQSIDNMVDVLEEGKPGGKIAGKPKKKVGKATTVGKTGKAKKNGK